MQSFAKFSGDVHKNWETFDENLLKSCEWSGAKECQSNRSRQELSNEYLIARIGFDRAESETLQVWIIDLSDHILDHIPSVL